MSLVNEMLRDLQQRDAAGSKPLVGLHAVPAAMRVGSMPSTRSWVMALSVVVIGVTALLWSYTDATNERQYSNAIAASVELPRVATASPEVSEPAAIRRTVLETNRLDYYLHFPPSTKTPAPAVVAVKLPDVMMRTKSGSDTRGDSLDDPGHAATVIKKAVSPAVRWRRDGLQALRAGKAIVAERQFHNLVAADPANPESHLFLHAALQAQSRSAAARTALLDGLERTSDPAQLAQVLAQELLAEGRVNHALDVLTAHRPGDRADLDYDSYLAAVNQRAGNHDVAADLYRMLVERQPANGAWWVGLAISQEAKGDAGAAARSFATATAGGTLNITLARYAAERLERLETGS